MKTLRSSRLVLATCLSAAALASAVFVERPAIACGGAFFDQRSVTVDGAAPTGSEAISVTDHRMIVSIDKKQTVLYDQIRFTGHPKELAWILPVKGDVKLGLSTDALFDILDKEVPLRVTAPRAKCPGCSTGGGSGGGGGIGGGSGGGCGSGTESSDGLSAGESRNAESTNPNADPNASEQQSENPVTVKKTSTVGPYETVQVSSNEPGALTKWLADNGYAVPKSFEPTLAIYIAEKFDFLAVKLRPGAETNAIRPIRVAFDGASNVVPMRASAAGPLANLGITMYVVADGSAYAPANYPVFTIPSEQLSWDWAAKKSNFLDLREKRSLESGYSAWEVEAAETREAMGPKVLSLVDYEGETAKADQAIDASALGSTGYRVVTRLHATLAPSALTKDLVLEPYIGAPTGTRLVSKSIGAPMCATFTDSCVKSGEVPTPAALQAGTPESAPRTPSAVALSGMVAALVAFFRPRKPKKA